MYYENDGICAKRMNKHLIWAISLMFIVVIICMTVVWINYNSWTVRFEMDDNTKEAIESIEFGEMARAGEREVWNCPAVLETGRYVFTDGILILPSGDELNCNSIRK